MDQPAFHVGTNGRRIGVPWSVLVHVGTTLIALAMAWGAIGVKLDQATARIAILEQQRTADTVLMQDLRQQLASATQKLTDLYADYERDANRYIRDANDRHTRGQ